MIEYTSLNVLLTSFLFIEQSRKGILLKKLNAEKTNKKGLTKKVEPGKTLEMLKEAALHEHEKKKHAK